jgi:hypothetical protein
MSDEKSQADKFREAARELETDDSEENFDRALKRIAVAPPKPQGSKKTDGEP